MTATATRLLDNYIAGKWKPASDPSGVLDVTNPATGETLARVPAVRVARGSRRTLGGPRALGDARDGQDDRRRTRRGCAYDRDGRVRVCDPDDDAGPHPRGRLARHRRRDDPTARRGVCGDRPVQLPGHGPLLVSTLRDRVRERVRPEAL